MTDILSREEVAHGDYSLRLMKASHEALRSALAAAEARTHELASAIDPPTPERGAARLSWFQEALIRAQQLQHVEARVEELEGALRGAEEEMLKLYKLVYPEWELVLLHSVFSAEYMEVLRVLAKEESSPTEERQWNS